MMMFQFHIALALGLIAIASGIALCVWPDRRHSGSGFAIALGVIIVILAILSTVCTINSGFASWKQGDFNMKHEMSTDDASTMNKPTSDVSPANKPAE